MLDTKKLRSTAAESGYALKPSFYLMGISQLGTTLGSTANISGKLSRVAKDLNRDIKEASDEPTDSEFEILSVEKIDENVYHIELKWQVPIYYWNPKRVRRESVHSLKLGFVLLHLKARKALVSCHTLTERSHITQIVSRALSIQFTPLKLTKQLLDQIGTFDTVKRAGYFFPDHRPDRPSNITYADDLLGSISEVLAHEESPAAERKLSFYRIPLLSLGERGVGATSDSAKLWIPSETPLGTVREFGVALLERVTGTLTKMKRRGDIEGLLRVVLSDSNPRLTMISPISLRRDVQELIRILVTMIVNKEKERPFRATVPLLTAGVPEFFEYPRIAMFDEESAVTSFWRSLDGSELLKFCFQDGRWFASAYPSRNAVDLEDLANPSNGNITSITDPADACHLVPTKELHDLILDIIQSLSGDIPELTNVVAMPFRLSSGVLRLDLSRALNKKKGALVGTVVSISEIKQLSTALTREISPAKRNQCIQILHELGEKCKWMGDSTCQTCLEDRQALCVRSLTARFMRNHMLLPHKGIELCDLEGEFDHSDLGALRCYVFSKNHKGSSGLTLRNSNGAILLAQIIAQLDKNTFDTVVAVCPSTINQDLRERLVWLGGLTDKAVLFLDGPVLSKMLVEFEDQAKFDGTNPEEIYKFSKRHHGRPLPPTQRAPGWLGAADA